MYVLDMFCFRVSLVTFHFEFFMIFVDIVCFQDVFIQKAVDYFKKTLKVRSVKTPITLYRLLL